MGVGLFYVECVRWNLMCDILVFLVCGECVVGWKCR